MSTATKNAAGVESFDHSKLSTLPEYQKAYKALDNLGRAITAAELGIKQMEWLRIVGQMASALSYRDSPLGSGHTQECCDGWPYKAQVEDNWLRGSYRCPVCQSAWPCGYAVDIGLWFD